MNIVVRTSPLAPPAFSGDASVIEIHDPVTGELVALFFHELAGAMCFANKTDTDWDAVRIRLGYLAPTGVIL